MSTLRVTIEPLIIHPHPNADALELAQVGLYRAVVRKGQFRSGDYGLYVPEQAIVPDELLEELGLVGRLGGKAKNRVTAVRLRGEVSQGIVCRPKALDHLWDGDPVHLHDVTGEVDYATELGITKWVPPVPVGMAGVQIPAPDLLGWIDIENIARYPNLFAPGETVVASEKVHGSACLMSLVVATGEVFVSSKGVGAKGLGLVESDTNLYWRAVRQFNLAAAAKTIADITGATRVGIFGEVYGSGVQDLHYGADAGRDDSIGYAAFDIRIVVNGVTSWLGPDEFYEAARITGLPAVPMLYAGPYDEATLIALASGTETVSGAGAHLREGLVVRPVAERHSDVVGGRAIGKIVSADYLTRGGAATEYE